MSLLSSWKWIVIHFFHDLYPRSVVCARCCRCTGNQCHNISATHFKHYLNNDITLKLLVCYLVPSLSMDIIKGVWFQLMPTSHKTEYYVFFQLSCQYKYTVTVRPISGCSLSNNILQRWHSVAVKRVWTLERNPFIIHSQLGRNAPFICAKCPDKLGWTL